MLGVHELLKMKGLETSDLEGASHVSGLCFDLLIEALTFQQMAIWDCLQCQPILT